MTEKKQTTIDDSFREEIGVLVEAQRKTEQIHVDFVRRTDEGFVRVYQSIEKLTNTVNSMSRPNWQTWIGFCGVLIVLVGAGITWVSAEMRHESNLRNIQWATQARMNQVMWNASPLGAITKYPEGPYFYP